MDDNFLSLSMEFQMEGSWNLVFNLPYYMPSSVSGQDEPKLALWLATRAGKMELSCLLRIRALCHKENLSCFGVLSHIINPLLTKLVQSRCLDIGLVLFFACLWTSTSSRSIHAQNPAILTSRLVNNPYIISSYKGKIIRLFFCKSSIIIMNISYSSEQEGAHLLIVNWSSEVICCKVEA